MTARHGTRRRYQTDCRCFPCSLAQSRYHQMYRAGGRSRMPAEPVREHVHALVASGWTQKDIGEVAGLGNSTVHHLLHDGRPSVNSNTAEALLALRPLTADGIHTHLRDILASGLTLRQIAEESGVPDCTIRQHLSGRTQTFRRRTALALAAVEPLPEPIVLDAQPLLDAVGGRLGKLDPADRRALYRARHDGRISERLADRIAINAGLGPLVLVYGPDLEEAAA